MNLSSLKSFEDFIFIAEAGVNHEGSIEEAIRMVEAAALAGADIIKFQAYKADQLAHKKYAKAYWDETEEKQTNQHNLFSKYETFSFTEWEKVKKACDANNIKFWLSVFDLELAQNLYKLCDGLKVASGDITFERLHKFILSSGLPSIFSTGASSIKEIEDLDNKIKPYNSISLFCRLSYPTTDINAELGMFTHLSKKFSTLKGISDHCKTGKGESVLLAFCLGATVLEKHFTITPHKSGNDHYHSITPEILKSSIDSIKRMKSLYKVSSNSIPTESEMPARAGARRSLFFNKDLKSGEILTEKDVIELRPVVGIEANMIGKVIGSKIKKDVKNFDPIYFDNLV